MHIEKRNIEDVLVLKSEKISDKRGWFQESYSQNKFINLGLEFQFVQDNLVYSKNNVLRGLHFQRTKSSFSKGKLVSCIKGKIFDVAVDLRPESDTYKSWVGYFLDEKDNKFIYIPEGFAHGYSVESKDTIVHYKCTKHYDPNSEIGIIWNDPDINIDWPSNNYILSDKDQNNVQLKDLVI